MLLLILIIALLLQNVAPQSIRRSAARRSQTLEEIQTQLDDFAKVNDAKDGTLCHVSSENLLLAAEATARGVLQGVCNPREIEDRLHNIESQIADQFTIVKTMILNIEQKMASQENNMKRYLRKLYGSMENLQTSCRSGGRYLAKQGQKHNRGSGAQDGPGISTPGKSRTAQTGTGVSSSGPGGATVPSPQRSAINDRSQISSSQLPSQDFDIDEDDFEDDEAEAAPNPRQFEIDKFNNTIHVENGKRVYTFYWQVDDMKYKIENWGIQRSLRSNSFYIFQYGYRMYMRIYPRQNGKNLFIHVGLTKGEYDEALEWPFTLKHRITIMDQSNSPVDTMSRIWDPQVLCSEWNWKRPQNYPNNDNYECVGLGLPHSDVTSRDYIQDNSLLIKFTVFLDPIFS